MARQSPALPSFGTAGDRSRKAADSRGKDASRRRCAPRHHCRFRPSKCPSSLPFDRPKKRRHNQGRAVPGAQAMITNWLPLHTAVRLLGAGKPPLAAASPTPLQDGQSCWFQNLLSSVNKPFLFSANPVGVRRRCGRLIECNLRMRRKRHRFHLLRQVSWMFL